MTLTIKRGIFCENFLVRQDGKVMNVSIQDIREKTGAFDVVRILDEEYQNIDLSKKFFTHFNLEDTDVEVGKTYLLPRIVDQGFFDHIKNKGNNPVLSFENIFVCKCVDVKNNVRYEDIKQNVFEFSMKTIKGVESLKDAIWKRYGISMPKLSKEQMFELGVAVAIHEIIDRKTFKFL